MKTTLKFFLIFIVTVLYGCEKKSNKAEIEMFIDQLLEGKYESMDLPAFSSSDIPALLEYRDAKTIITGFPFNPASSFRSTDCRLGIYVLWTIESVRAVEIESERLIGRFPSQNAILALRDSHELMPVTNEESHRDAARAYYEWWYSSSLISDKMKKDPLGGTKYLWH